MNWRHIIAAEIHFGMRRRHVGLLPRALTAHSKIFTMFHPLESCHR